MMFYLDPTTNTFQNMCVLHPNLQAGGSSKMCREDRSTGMRRWTHLLWQILLWIHIKTETDLVGTYVIFIDCVLAICLFSRQEERDNSDNTSGLGKALHIKNCENGMPFGRYGACPIDYNYADHLEVAARTWVS
jgi:hypothetical protein